MAQHSSFKSGHISIFEVRTSIKVVGGDPSVIEFAVSRPSQR